MSSVPLLLESFPAPPTHIPTTPTFTHHPLPPAISPSSSSSNSGHSFSTSNPPPSRPPSVPLPPVPRRSRGSDGSSTVSTLYSQRRSSRYSATGSVFRPESTYSTYSVGSTRPDSVMSTVSAKSNGRSYEGHGLDRFTEEDAYGGIRNDDDEEPEVQLTRMRLSISPMPPSPEPGASNPPSSFHFKGKSGNKDRELLSAVSMNDLPPSSDIEDDNPVDKRKSNASIGSVSTASSIVILQSSLRRKKPKRISIGDVEHSTVYPLSSPVLSPTSNVSSVLSPRTPLTPSLTTPPPSAFLLTRTPPTPLTPAFTEGMNPINTTTGETLSPGSSPTTTTTSSPAYPSPPSSFSSYNEKVASVPTTPPPTTTASESLFAEAQSQSPQSNAIDPHALHRELRSARSRSRGHRERLGMRHNSGVDAEMPTPPLPTTPSSGPLTPSSELEPIAIAKSQPVGPGKVVEPNKRAPRLRSRSRSKSPDISTLLTETRERARSQSRSAAKSRASSASGTSTPLGRGASSRRRQSAKRRESEGYSGTHHDRYQHPPSSYSFAGEEGLNRRASDGMQPSTSSSAVVRGRKTSQRKLGHVYPREDEEEERRINKLERQLDGDPNGSDSDSGEEMKDTRGFGFDGVERVRDSVDDIFGEYLDESVVGSGDDEPVGGGNWEEDEGDQDSDSSLDLHTPLPHLMLREGLLSPNSKILPQTNPLSASASMESFASLATCNGGSGGDERPGSVASMASKADSVMTKSGIFKDARDTPSRRLRHKDGRLLRGGLGLTTGLGWSDSEDEDAPSPFTRRVSSAITLSRKSSLASLGDGTFYGDSSRVSTISSKSKSYGNLRQSASVSSLRHAARAGRASTVSYAPSGSKGRSSKLSRSYSSRDLADFNEDDEVDDLGFRRDVGDSGKSKVRSHGSQASDEGRQPVSKAVHEEYVIQTPSSTTSSVSIPLPVTPKDYEFTSRTPTVEDVPNRVGSGYQRIVVDKDKMLPPLPNPRTGSIRRPQAGALAARRQASAAARAATLSIATAEGITLGPESSFVDNGDSTSTVGNSTTVTASTLSSIPMRKRSGSQSSSLRTSSSSSSSLRNAAGSAASQSEIPPVPSLPTQPLKQLQLPRYSVGSGKTNTHKQSAVPVPSISQAAAGKMSRSISSGQSRVPTLATSVSMGTLRGSQGSRTAPTTPVTPTTPGKPRTGTGMVYRSSGSVSGLSALKLPTSRNMGGI